MDEYSHAGAASPLSHPDVLWYAGLGAGLTPADPERCRLLELGCGDGANLLPLAHRLPGADMVGVEAGSAALERARADAGDLGLERLTLHAADPLESLELEGFDYVVAPDLLLRSGAVAERVLSRVATALAPEGVAFLAYAAEPGRRMNC